MQRSLLGRLLTGVCVGGALLCAWLALRDNNALHAILAVAFVVLASLHARSFSAEHAAELDRRQAALRARTPPARRSGLARGMIWGGVALASASLLAMPFSDAPRLPLALFGALFGVFVAVLGALERRQLREEASDSES